MNAVRSCLGGCRSSQNEQSSLEDSEGANTAALAEGQSLQFRCWRLATKDNIEPDRKQRRHALIERRAAKAGVQDIARTATPSIVRPLFSSRLSRNGSRSGCAAMIGRSLEEASTSSTFSPSSSPDPGFS